MNSDELKQKDRKTERQKSRKDKREVMSGYGWLWVVMGWLWGGYGCLWGGYGWLWVVMGGYGWLRVVIGCNHPVFMG